MRLLLHVCNSLVIIGILAVAVNKYDDYRRRKIDIKFIKTKITKSSPSQMMELNNYFLEINLFLLALKINLKKRKVILAPIIGLF